MPTSKKHHGYFITLEGIEGVGKSTCLKFINRYLTQQKINTLTTREPGGTPIAEAIRQLLLTSYKEKVCDDAELLLFFAGRAQHLAQVILPALSENKWVLCDRFTDASYAYQGGGRGFSQERIAVLEQWVQKGLRPDLTLLFDAPIATAFSRVKKRGRPDRIEAEQKQFFTRVRNCYLERAKQEPQRFRVIDARKPLAAVKQQLRAILDEVIQKRVKA